jgi:hypothetical protein
MKLHYQIILLLLSLSTQAFSKENMVYAGNFDAKIKTVLATNKVYINADVWPGYDRNFLITLRNVDVPEPFDKAPVCHMRLIEEGKKFTRKFIRNAEKLEVHGISMKDSSKEKGIANIYDGKTTLGEALIKKGYARSSSIVKDTVWCSDED